MAETNHTTISIEGTTLPVLEHAGHRVVTLGMIDTVHGRPEGTAGRNFRKNRNRFVEGEDYWKISADEFRRRFSGLISERATEEVTVLSETGYLMLVKSFTDDLAWKVQRQLVNAYFKAKPETIDPGAIEQRPWHQRPLEERNAELRTADSIGKYGNRALAWWYLSEVAKVATFPRFLLPAWHQNALDVPVAEVSIKMPFVIEGRR